MPDSNPVKLTKSHITVFLLMVYLISPLSLLFGNGYNEIKTIAVPIIFLLFGILFVPTALLFSALIYYTAVKFSKKRGYFGLTYLLTLIGGETGILVSFFIERATSDSGYTGYHYLVYPWLTGGLALAFGTAAVLLSIRKVQ